MPKAACEITQVGGQKDCSADFHSPSPQSSPRGPSKHAGLLGTVLPSRRPVPWLPLLPGCLLPQAWSHSPPAASCPLGVCTAYPVCTAPRPLPGSLCVMWASLASSGSQSRSPEGPQLPSGGLPQPAVARVPAGSPRQTSGRLGQMLLCAAGAPVQRAHLC